MNDFSAVTALAFVTLTVGIGFFTSWLPQLRRLRLWRLLLLGLAGVFLMLPLAALLRSNTLGWMAGLSFIFVLPVLLLLGIGVVLGHWLAVKDPKKDIEKDEAAIAPVAAPSPSLSFSSPFSLKSAANPHGWWAALRK